MKTEQEIREKIKKIELGITENERILRKPQVTYNEAQDAQVVIREYKLRKGILEWVIND